MDKFQIPKTTPATTAKVTTKIKILSLALPARKSLSWSPEEADKKTGGGGNLGQGIGELVTLVTN